MVAAPPPAPAQTSPSVQTAPTISGTPSAGETLTCGSGAWTGDPASHTYQWNRDGTTIAGATASTYQVQSEDEGTTLTCTVTAMNAAGSSSPVTTSGVTIPVPLVAGCPAARGSATRHGIGPADLDITHARAGKAFPGASTRDQPNKLYFCLTPTGIRVGFPSRKLLAAFPRVDRRRYAGRVIWISTASASYTVDRVRVGESVARAARTSRLSAPFKVGRNTWYLAPDERGTAVYKTRGGFLQEVGITIRAVVGKTRASQRTFLTSFG